MAYKKKTDLQYAPKGVRKSAAEAGEKFYFTDLPCLKGHISKRYVKGGQCITCREISSSSQKHKDSNKEWYQRAKKSHLLRMKEYRTFNREYLRAKDKAWYKKNREAICARKNGMLGLPTRDMPAVCDICSQPNRKGKSLSMDHDHDTGLFRGWLCDLCNTAIGKLGDNSEGLRRALRYLEAAEKQTRAA